MPNKGIYSEDRRWSDKYIPEMKRIIGPYLLSAAPLREDIQEATDLIVLIGRDMRIACRMRRAGYADRYGRQFTIRYDRGSGIETEYSKILYGGWGDWMFYGHARDDESFVIAKWFLIDLREFRRLMHRDMHYKNKNRQIRCGILANHSDTTRFAWFDIDSFPVSSDQKPLIIAEGAI